MGSKSFEEVEGEFKGKMKSLLGFHREKMAEYWGWIKKLLEVSAANFLGENDREKKKELSKERGSYEKFFVGVLISVYGPRMKGAFIRSLGKKLVRQGGRNDGLQANGRIGRIFDKLRLLNSTIERALEDGRYDGRKGLMKKVEPRCVRGQVEVREIVGKISTIHGEFKELHEEMRRCVVHSARAMREARRKWEAKNWLEMKEELFGEKSFLKEAEDFMDRVSRDFLSEEGEVEQKKGNGRKVFSEGKNVFRETASGRER